MNALGLVTELGTIREESKTLRMLMMMMMMIIITAKVRDTNLRSDVG